MDVRTMPGHLIRRLHQRSSQVFAQRTRDAGFDLTSVQFAAMDAIMANPGIDQARVAALIAYDRATIGGVIDRLEQKGIVARRISRRDRRAREVTLTEKGAALLTSLRPVVQDLQADILADLSPAERDTLVTLLDKAVGAKKGAA